MWQVFWLGNQSRCIYGLLLQQASNCQVIKPNIFFSFSLDLLTRYIRARNMLREESVSWDETDMEMSKVHRGIQRRGQSMLSAAGGGAWRGTLTGDWPPLPSLPGTEPEVPRAKAQSWAIPPLYPTPHAGELQLGGVEPAERMWVGWWPGVSLEAPDHPGFIGSCLAFELIHHNTLETFFFFF